MPLLPTNQRSGNKDDVCSPNQLDSDLEANYNDKFNENMSKSNIIWQQQCQDELDEYRSRLDMSPLITERELTHMTTGPLSPT